MGNAIRKLAVSDFLPIFFAHIFLAIDALEGLVRGSKMISTSIKWKISLGSTLLLVVSLLPH